MPLYDPVYGYPNYAIPQPTVQMSVPQPAQPVNPQPPFVKIVTVAGEQAAKGLKLSAGSTLLAADENESVIWFIKANDVGPNTVAKIPFDPSIFGGSTTSTSVDLSPIEKRLADIEERMKRYESNDESDKQRSNGSGNNNGRR